MKKYYDWNKKKKPCSSSQRVVNTEEEVEKEGSFCPESKKKRRVHQL